MDEEGTGLVELGKIERARALIRECRDATAVRDIRDKARAIQTYHRERGTALEVQMDAAEIAVRAEIRLGEILAATLRKGRPPKNVTPADSFGLDDFDVTRQQSSRWQKAAEAPPELADRYIETARERGAVPNSTALAELARLDHADAAGLVEMVARGEARDLRAALRAYHHRKRVEDFGEKARAPDALGELGTFSLVYIDPPWRYAEGTTDPSREIENRYPTMALEEIADLPVGELAAPDAVLAMWVPSPMLFDARTFRGAPATGVVAPLLAAWGFEYRAIKVWDKIKLGAGHWWRVQHEVLILAIRGEVPTPEPANRAPSVLRERSTSKHSEKPSAMRDELDRMFPGGRKIEMFARGTAPDGWLFWGNQADNLGR